MGSAVKEKDGLRVPATPVREEGHRWLLTTAEKATFKHIDSDDPGIVRVVDLIVNDTEPAYVRGLAARSLAAICLHVTGAKAKLVGSEKWASIVDSLLEVVGQCNQPRIRTKLAETDRSRVQRNCCLALSILMEDPTTSADHEEEKGQPKVPRRPGTSRETEQSHPTQSERWSEEMHLHGLRSASREELVTLWQSIRMEHKPARVIPKPKAKREQKRVPAPPPGAAYSTAAATAAAAAAACGAIRLGVDAKQQATPMKDLLQRVKHVTLKIHERSHPSKHVLTVKDADSSRLQPQRRDGHEPSRTKPPPAARPHAVGAHGAGSASTMSGVTEPLDLPSVGEPSHATSVSDAHVPLSTEKQESEGVVGYLRWHQSRLREPMHPEPPLRPTIVSGEKALRDQSWVPNSTVTDLPEKDRKIGFQLPRLWFSKALLRGSRQAVTLPPKRKPPKELARRPINSKLIEEEYHRVLAYNNYQVLQRLTQMDPEFKTGFSRDVWQRVVELFRHNAHSHTVKALWTPRHGLARERFLWRRQVEDTHLAEPRIAMHKSPSRQKRAAFGVALQDVKLRPKPDSSIPPPRSGDAAADFIRDVAQPKDQVDDGEVRAAEEAKAELRKLRLSSILRSEELQGLPSGVARAFRQEQRLWRRVLRREMQAVTKQEQKLHDQLLDQIQAARGRMSWSMHMQFEGGPALIKQRLIRALELWAREYERSQMVMAVAFWRLHIQRVKYELEAEEYKQIAARDKMVRAIRKMALRVKMQGFEKFVYRVAWSIWEERDGAVRKLQRQYRRWRDYRRFLLMHEIAHINGPLADVYMDNPRQGLKFYVNHKVRLDRRRIWLATVTIQKEFRKKVNCRWYVRMLGSVVVVQARWRMWSDRRAFLHLRAMTMKLQATGRMLLAKWKYREWKKKSVVVQKYMRAHLSRAGYYRLRYHIRAPEEKLNVMAMKIQQRYRGWKARKALHEEKVMKEKRWKAALKMQLFWYKHTNAFSTFVLLSTLRAMDQQEHTFHDEVHRRTRYYNVRKLQRWYVAHLQRRRESAAVRLQCWFRGLMGYDLLAILRRERWASRKIRHWGIAMMRKRNRASTKIAFWWFSRKPGRLLRHLEVWAQAEELKEELQERDMRDRAAARIQAIVHGIWTRREVKEVKNAKNIQRVIRGFLGRRKALRQFRAARHRKVVVHVNRMIAQAVEKEVMRLVALYTAKATKLQQVYRGHLTRVILGRCRAIARQQTVAALRIQRAYRAHLRLVEAYLTYQRRHRDLQNPLRVLRHVAAVVRRALRTGLTTYHPENEQIGMRMPTWARRLGAYDIVPLLRAAKIERVDQLPSVTDDKLKRWGLDEKVYKGQREGIFDAPAVRSTMHALLTLLDVPPRLWPLRWRTIYEGFKVIEGPTQAEVVRTLFIEAYGATLSTRAEAFVKEVASEELTHLQLRRFFKMYKSASKANEHQSELVTFAERATEVAHDQQRVLEAVDLLHSGIERACGILPNELSIWSRLSAARQHYDQLLRLQRRASIIPRLLKHQSSLCRTLCMDMYLLLDELQSMNIATRRIQRVFRTYASRQRQARVRHETAVKRIHEQYIDERTTNHVYNFWYAERIKEQEEAEQRYREEIAQRDRRLIEDALKTVVPYGWQRQWVPGEQVNQDDGHFVFRMTKNGKVVQEQTERPSYTHEHWAAAVEIKAALKVFVVKQKLRRFRSARRTKKLQDAHKVVWDARQRERSQAVTFRIAVVSLSAGHMFRAYAGLATKEQEELQCFQKKMAELLDVDAALQVGFPVHATFGGLTYHYPGTVYQVNPTQYSTPEGIRWYPKGTFGVLYDDGDCDPAVPLKSIRVLKLRVGRPVEARYKGGDAYFPGKVAHVLERNCAALSYTLRYDDGDEETGVRRWNIRVQDMEAERMNAMIDRLGREYEESKRWRADRAERIGKKKKEWEDSQRALISSFEAARKGRGATTKDLRSQMGRGAKAHNDWQQQLQEVMDMAKLSDQLLQARRTRIGVRVNIDCTHVDLPYGWAAVVDPETSVTMYECVTGEYRGTSPTYSHIEDFAALRVQTAWRGHRAKRLIHNLLQDENPLALTRATIRDANKVAWVGFAEEGMTLDLFLNRLGLHHVLNELSSTMGKEKYAALTLDRLKRWEDKELRKTGVATDTDRQLIIRMAKREAVLTQSFEFLNYFYGPSDGRSLAQCIAESRPRLSDALIRAFPGNEKRVEKMADGLIKSHFPITHAQLTYFLTKYAGKAAAAQANIEELVDVRTTSSLKQERMAFIIYRRGAMRLSVLLSKLSLHVLRDRVLAAVAQADDVRQQPTADGAGDSAMSKTTTAPDALSPRPASSSKKDALYSGAEGKAAYILRCNAFQEVFRWWEASIKVQTKFRCYVARKAHKNRLSRRQRAATLFQALRRRYKARVQALELKAQMESDWEQLWSYDAKSFYYYHKRAGTSMWEDPGVPYRPMVRDSYTGRLIQAWPQLDWPAATEKTAPRGMCMKCFTREASRRCNACFQRRTQQGWNKGYAYYCFGCFADAHKDDPDMREHGFTVIKSTKPPQLKCTVCGLLANRRCHGIRVLEKHRDRLEQVMARARTAEKRLTVEEFVKAFVEEVGVPFSQKKIEFMFKECGGYAKVSAYDLWHAVGNVIDDHQEPCGENYCSSCWQESHQRGQRAKHVWIGFKAGWSACAGCEREPARQLCVECEDELCDECFKAAHMKGRKRMHTSTPIKEPMDPQDTPCPICERRPAWPECEDCQQRFCDSCLLFSHPDQCRAKLRSLDRDKDVVSDACVVCGKAPDTMCVQCGDVYCSEKWAGNPGCFTKAHRRGNRKLHIKQPYTYVQELQAKLAQRKEEEERMRVEQEAREAARKAASEAVARKVESILSIKKQLRRQQLMEDARVEVYRRAAERERLAVVGSAYNE